MKLAPTGAAKVLKYATVKNCYIHNLAEIPFSFAHSALVSGTVKLSYFGSNGLIASEVSRCGISESGHDEYITIRPFLIKATVFCIYFPLKII